MRAQKITPNLIVHDVASSMKFYETVLGLEPAIRVPEHPPYVFGSVANGSVEIFFNDQKMVAEDYPPLGKNPIGGTLTQFIEVEGLQEVMERVQKAGARIVMPVKDQFYGMREFAFEDPEGWIITIAEKIK